MPSVFPNLSKKIKDYLSNNQQHYRISQHQKVWQQDLTKAKRRAEQPRRGILGDRGHPRLGRAARGPHWRRQDLHQPERSSAQPAARKSRSRSECARVACLSPVNLGRRMLRDNEGSETTFTLLISKYKYQQVEK